MSADLETNVEFWDKKEKKMKNFEITYSYNLIARIIIRAQIRGEKLNLRDQQ